jgi:hypothetical protein
VSLRYWEATREAIIATLRADIATAGLPTDQMDVLSRDLTNAAIEAYTGSVYGHEIRLHPEEQRR